MPLYTVFVNIKREIKIDEENNSKWNFHSQNFERIYLICEFKREKNSEQIFTWLDSATKNGKIGEKIFFDLAMKKM